MTHPDLIGNVLCLDFANTVSSRPHAARDALVDRAAAWTWAAAAGLSSEDSPRPGPRDTQDLTMLRALRESIWVVFDSVVDEQFPPERATANLITAQSAGLRTVAWEVSGATLQPLWPAAVQLGGLAGPVADTAVRLLRNGPLDRVGRCPACRWLFFDISRRGGRRWCSMAACGGRTKSARYAARHRREES